MKKIGILFGMENSFPQAFVDEINSRGEKDIVAEFIKIDKLSQASDSGYAVIFDRISHDVPFYRAYLKNAALMGTTIVNNPFWWSADEKFFNNALATKIGVPVPKTVILPSRELPDDTTDESFSNLIYPLDWKGIFVYVGFTAYMKPFSGGGWKNVYRLESMEDFFEKHAETKQLVMLLQEEIVFDQYYRCYCIGGKDVRIMQYEPRNPHHLRYVTEGGRPANDKLLTTIKDYVLKLNHALGYDFNTVEFAVRDGIPYAIDFCNPAPDADVNSVGEKNFEWVVETAARYAVERAKAQKTGQDNLTWGTFIRNAAGVNVPEVAKKAVAKVAAPKAEKAVKAPVEKKPVAKKATAKI
jgi:glutathione synthase/RimK-type ligase-like ATP-grasp enzyme